MMKNQTRINKLLTVLLLLCVLFVCMAGTAMAAEDCAHTFTDGQCSTCGVMGGYCGAETNEGGEQSVTWTLADNHLVISGTGAMADYTPSTRPWADYYDNVTNLVIEDGVTAIGNAAFYECKYLTSVEMPDSVTSIGKSAFSKCAGLTSLDLPDNVTFIGREAFYACTGLTSLTIPASVTEMSDAFYGCSGLTDITISYGVTSIHGAFKRCTGLTSITIPNSVTSISWAFYGCTGLESIVVPDSVTEMDYAFDGCTGLRSANIPSSVTSIKGAFTNCTSLTSIEIPDSVTTIGNSAFDGCTGLTSIAIPDSVTTIGDSAFDGCTGLTSIEIPDSVTTISDQAFDGCTGLKSVAIPNSVTEIGDSAFDGCTQVSTVIISCTPNGAVLSCIYQNFSRAEWIDVHAYENGACTDCDATCDHNDIDDNGKCRVCGLQHVASVTVGSEVTYYKTLQEAMSAADKKTATVKLLADGEITALTEFYSPSDITLDLNGKTITASGALLVFGDKLTITGNGKYITDGKRGDVITVMNKGTLTIENGTFVDTSSYGVLLQVDGETNIRGGSFTTTGQYSAPISNGGNMMVTGDSTFAGNADRMEFSINGAGTLDLSGVTANMDGWRVDANGTTVTVGDELILPDGYALKVGENFVTTLASGEIGTIVAHTHDYTTPKFDNTHHWTACACGAATEKVTHTFTYTPVTGKEVHIVGCSGCTYTAAEPHAFTQNDAGEWVCDCKAKAVASITSGSTVTKYMDFADALAAWTDGTTLTLLDNVTYDASIEPGAGTRTFVGGKHTLDLGSANINNTGTLTITSGTITADNMAGGTIENWGELIINGNSVISNNENAAVMNLNKFEATGGTLTASTGLDNEDDGVAVLNGTTLSNVLTWGNVTLTNCTITLDDSSTNHLDFRGGKVTINGDCAGWGVIYFGDNSAVVGTDIVLPDNYYLFRNATIIPTLEYHEEATIGKHTSADHKYEYTPNSDGLTHNKTCTVGCGVGETNVPHTAPDAEGKCVCGAQIVAQVGEEAYYSDFGKAVAAWTDGTTLTLLDNVSYDSGITLDAGTRTFDGGDYTLDLAGKGLLNEGTLTIQNAKITSNAAGVIVVDNQGMMMIKKSTITNSEGTAIGNGASLTVENSVLNAMSACLSTNGETAALTNCTLNCQEIEIEYAKGKLTIAGDCDGWEVRNTGDELVAIGTYIELPAGYYMFELTEPGAPERLVTSLNRFGTIRAHEHKYTYTDNHDGTHSYGCTCGLATVDLHDFAENAAGEWVCACKAKAVAKVGGTCYTDFAKAVAAWTDGTTLTLLDDVSYDSGIAHRDDATRTFVGGEHTLTLGSNWTNYATLTIKSGTIDGEGMNGVYNYGTLTIENGTITGKTYGVYNKGTLTIESVTINAVNQGVATDQNGETIIRGGTINAGLYAVSAHHGKTTITGNVQLNGKKHDLWFYGGAMDLSECTAVAALTVYNKSGATVTIGNTVDKTLQLPANYYVFDIEGHILPELADAGSGTIGPHTDEDHIFDYTPNGDGLTHDMTCTAGCGAGETNVPHTAPDAEGKCVCGAQLVAEVGGTYYADFGKAVAAWTDGTTLTLLDDVGYDSDINLGAGTRTFVGREHTLTLTSEADRVYNDGTLTIASGTIISEGFYAIQNDGTLNIEGGTVSTTAMGGIAVDNNGGTLTITGGKVSAMANNGFAITNNGDMTLDGGTIEGYSCIENSGTAELKRGTVTASDGYALHNFGTATLSGADLATEGNNPAVFCNSGKTTISGGTLAGNGEVVIWRVGGTLTITTTGCNGWKVISSAETATIGEDITLPKGYYVFDDDGKFIPNLEAGVIGTITAHTHKTLPIDNKDGKSHDLGCVCGMESNQEIPHFVLDAEDKCVCGAQLVAKVGEAYYSDIAVAMDDWANNGGTMTLLDDVSYGDAIELMGGSYTFNGDQFTLNVTPYMVSVYEGATLNCTGGTLKGAISVSEGATLNVEGGTIARDIQNHGTTILKHASIIPEAYYAIVNHGTLTISDSTMQCYDHDTAAEIWNQVGGTVTIDNTADPDGWRIKNNTSDAMAMSCLTLPTNYYVFMDNEAVTELAAGAIGIIRQHSHSYTATADEDNDTITYACTCGIGTETAKILAPAETLVYNGMAYVPTVEVTGSTVEPAVVYTQNGQGVAEIKNAGDYTATINWHGKEVSMSITILPADIEVATVTVAKETYTGFAITPTYTVSMNEERLGQNTDYTVIFPEEMANAGEKELTFIGMGNYTGTKKVPYTINKATPTVTPPKATEGLTYSGFKQQLLSNAGYTTGGTLLYSLDGQTWSEEVPMGTDVGDYTVYYKVDGGTNYESVEAQSLTASIGKADAGVANVPKANNRTYDGTEQPLVTAGSASAGQMVYSLEENGTYTENIPTAKNAGDYTVWYYVQGGDNYHDGEKASVKVTIAPIMLEVSGDGVAYVKTYDGTTSADTATWKTPIPSVEGDLVLGDELQVTADLFPAYTTSKVGSYDAEIEVELRGKDAQNYKLTADKVTVTAIIEPKPLTATAAEGSRAYDATAEWVAPLELDGIIGSDDVSGWAEFQLPGINVGEYTEATLWEKPELTGADAGNYTVAPQDVTFVKATITKAAADKWSVNVAAQEVLVGSGLNAVVVPAIGTGIGNEEVQITAMTLYSDAELQTPATDADISSLAEGESITLYYKAAADNYEAATGPMTVKAIVHQHEWTYAADEATDTITATCGGTIGTCPSAEQSITLNAPDAVYSGNPVEAEVSPDGADLTYNLRYTGTNYDSADAPANVGDYTVTMTVGDKSVSDTFTISPKDISVVQSIQFSLAQTSFVYSGEAPALNVTGVDSSVGNYTMQENTDYTVGTVQVNAGSHKLTVTGMGNYTGTVEVDYTIARAPIGAAEITAEAQVYTGEALMPAFTVTLNGKTLGDSDYVFEWTNNVNVGKGKIVINGVGNYEGQAEGTFDIASAPANLTAETYLGESQKGDFTYGDVITIKGAVTVDQQNTFSLRRAPAANEVALYLEGGNDVIAGPVAADPATGEFTLTYDTSNKDIDIGQRNLTLAYVSDGNKQDTTGSLTVTLNPKELTIINAGADDRVYEKGNKLVDVTGVDLDGIVGIGDDVKVDATNLTGEISSSDAGTYTSVKLADLTLIGNDKEFYTISDATVTTSVEITPKEITNPTIVLDASSFVYDGTEKKPVVTAVKDGDDLIDAAEYTVSYTNNIEMGTATVTLTDVAGGNYTVSGSTTFHITQSGTAMTATADKNSYTYGETITVTGTVKATGTAPAATLTLRSAPAAQQVALFAADGTQLTDPVYVVDGAYTLTYNTADKDILPAASITLTVKFVGDDNMADQSAAVTVALTAKSVAPVLTGTASKAYDGTDTVTDAGNLTINLNEIIAGDTVSATAAGYAYADETVGQSKTVTAKGIALSGADSIFYTLAQTEASAQIGEIKKAMLIGLTAPADTTLDVYCADADTVIGKLPDTVVYHLADGKTVDLKVEWSCTAYDSTPGATNTFAWAINDSEKLACYEIAQNVADDGTIIVTNSEFLPVTVTGTDTAITYNGTAYDVTQMFTIDSNAGAAAFEIISGGTGEGTLNGSALTITRAGTITIKVTTAPNAAYAAGEATAVLTINKGTPAVTVPTGLTAWYGQKLSDIVLPTVDGGAWSWTDMNSTVGDAGVQTHQAIFTPADTNLWNITTHPVNITVAQAGTSFGEMKVYNGDTETTTFTYGETITVQAEATAVRPAAFSLRSLLAPAKHQMALFIRTADGSEVQISEAVNEKNGVYTMTYNTTGKALKIGDNALIAKFVGDENMADYQETVLVTLNPKELTIASLTAQDRVYEPGNQQVAITGTKVSGKADANDDVSVLTDGMTATINSENVGTYDTALIPQDVSLTGNHAGYYFATGNVSVSIPQGVEITQSTPYTASGTPAQPVFDPIYQDGQTLGDIPVSLPAGTFNVPGNIEWEAPGDTPVTEGTPFTWVFTPDDPNWKPVTGTVVIYPDGEPPVITAPAGDQEVTVYEDEQGTMFITAADATSYQWYINRYDGLGYVPISGATSASYTTSVVNLGNDGFTYYCVASNAYGNAESPVFLLQVLEKIEVPETGDESNIALWTALMLLSIAGLTIITMNGRRSKITC